MVPILGFTFGVSASFAKEDPVDREVEEIQVRSTRLPQLGEQPSAVVTSVSVEDLGAGVLSAAVVDNIAPAVRLKEFGGLGQMITIGIRGAAPNQTQVQIDGVPLKDSSGAGIDLSALPVGFVERIELQRGAASSQYGSGAMGGVLNLVTRTEQKDGLFWRISGGSLGSFLGSAGMAVASGPGRFLIMASGLHTAGDFLYTDDRGTAYNPQDDRQMIRRNNDAHQGGLLLKYSAQINDNLVLKLTEHMSGQERGVAGLLGFTALKAREKDWSNLLDLRGRLLLGRCSMQLGANLWTFGHHLEDPLGELTGVPIDNRQERQELNLFAHLLLPWKDHLLRFSVSGGQASLRDLLFDNPQRKALEATLSLELAFWDRRLVVIPAGRLSYFSDAKWQAAPSLGAALELSAQWILKANVARAFRVPDFGELYLQSGYATGNQALVPESAISADVELTLRVGKKIHVAAAMFYSRYQDLILFEPGSNFRYRPMNVGAADIGGFELEARLAPSPGLMLNGQYSLLLTADRSGKPNREGMELPGRPRHTAGIQARWHRDVFIAEAEGHWVSSNYVNEANTKELPARLLLSAGIGVEPTSGVWVLLQLKNLLNSQVQDVRGLPLPGLSFFITVGYSGKEPT